MFGVDGVDALEKGQLASVRSEYCFKSTQLLEEFWMTT